MDNVIRASKFYLRNPLPENYLELKSHDLQSYVKLHALSEYLDVDPSEILQLIVDLSSEFDLVAYESKIKFKNVLLNHFQ